MKEKGERRTYTEEKEDEGKGGGKKGREERE